MILGIRILDDDGNPLIPDAVVVNGVTVGNADFITGSYPDNSIYTISIIKEGYYPYYQSFQVFDIDLEFSVRMISIECKGRNEDEDSGNGDDNNGGDNGNDNGGDSGDNGNDNGDDNNGDGGDGDDNSGDGGGDDGNDNGGGEGNSGDNNGDNGDNNGDDNDNNDEGRYIGKDEGRNSGGDEEYIKNRREYIEDREENNKDEVKNELKSNENDGGNKEDNWVNNEDDDDSGDDDGGGYNIDRGDNHVGGNNGDDGDGEGKNLDNGNNGGGSGNHGGGHNENEEGYYNNCCNASFMVIDNPCNNSKTIIKTSSSPAPLYLYDENNNLIEFGNQLVIPDYLICKELNNFLIVSKLDKDCGCDGTDYPPCYEEIPLQIPKQSCLCEGSFSFTHNYCYDKIYPFIDFQTTKFFKQERWYIIKGIDVTFYFNIPCIRTSLLVYKQDENQYEEIEYRKETRIKLQLLKDGEVLLEIEEILADDFSEEDLNVFLSNLILEYNFEEHGKYELVSIVETNCNTKEYRKEIYVTSDINIFVNEDCRLYDLIICNDIFTLSVRRIDENENIAEISFNQSEFEGNEGDIFITDEMKLNMGVDDGVYVITINNGLEEKSFIVVHFCNAKNCYISLSKKLYCNEEEVTDRFMYSVVSFYILYRLVIEYYTLHHPIEILMTTLSNSDNLKYIEIDKALQKMKEICDACGAGLNEEGVYEDCGCTEKKNTE